jgi:murein L,D-transpeptidase YafK
MTKNVWFIGYIIIAIFFSQAALTAPVKSLPAPLLLMDSFFSHHVIIAEKSTHKLYLYQNLPTGPKMVKVFQMATGKKAGDKIFQGDHRTPEGVYYLTEFLTHQDLISRHGKQGEIYGVGAFVLNYPNPIDEAAGKTGGGIWLHSTNDETRIEKGLDSRGCIVTANSDLIDISRYIELNRTPVIVVHELSFLQLDTWKTKSQKVKNTIEAWVQAWSSEDFENYISSYHLNFSDPTKGGIKAFSTYKKAVFAKAGKPEVRISDLSLLQGGPYIMATFKQEYRSKTIQDVGRKTLYLKQDEYYNWKIVSEKWSKHGIPTTPVTNQVAFQPSNRFFESSNPRKILGDRLLRAVNSASETPLADKSSN